MIRNRPKPPRPLTLKQRRFVLELPTARSQTEAAVKAGYAPISAHVQATRAIQNDNVAPAIKAAFEAATSQKVMTVVRRKERLSELAEDDPTRRDPIGAIAELNKMERVYGEPPARDSALEWLLELRKLMQGAQTEGPRVLTEAERAQASLDRMLEPGQQEEANASDQG